mmetsp:Transcript_48651/g.35822  ORF Transcript_48651/g.35822 Transcript_48651/m.35822 type:complete len:119 (+) Transcript_48651:113-469(+)
MDFGRQEALLKQQLEFQRGKLSDLQKQVDDSNRIFDEKLRGLKSEVQEEANAQIERVTSEKELWENKYEQKRRALKELEMSMSKVNQQLEGKVNSLLKQIEKLEDEKSQQEEYYEEKV